MGVVTRPPPPPPLAVPGSRDGSNPAVFAVALLAASPSWSARALLRCDCPSIPTLRVRHAAVFAPRAQLQEGLEAVSASSAEESYNVSTALVRFILNRECLFGQQFFVVGSDPSLGLWDTSAAVPLEWSEGHVWSAQLDLTVGFSVKYKFILRGVSGEIEWQPGEDRVLQPWQTTKTIIVIEEWENAEKQIIAVEEYENVGEQSTDDEELSPVSKEVSTDGSLQTTETCAMEENSDIFTYDGLIGINADNVNKQSHTSSKAVLVPGLPREPTLEVVESAVKFNSEDYCMSPRSGDSESTTLKGGTHSTSKVKNEGERTKVTIEPSTDKPNETAPYNDVAVKINEGIEDLLPASQVVRHDIHWGRETLHKLLSTLGLFQGESA